MTSTETLRLITIISSFSILAYFIFVIIKIKRLRYIALFLATLVANIFIRSIAVLFFTPLTADQIILFNNWNLATTLQILIMMFSLIDQEFPKEVAEVMKEIGKERKLIEVFTGSTYDNKTNIDPATFAMILTQYAPGTWLYEQEILGNVVSHGGVLGNVEWFKDHIIEYPPEEVRDRVRYWDLAATEKKVIKGGILDPDETVGSLLSFQKLPDHLDFFLEDQTCGFWEWQELKENIYQTALRDGPGVTIVFEQEPASGGKNQVAALIEDFKNRLPGWSLPRGHNPREYGDKVMRANLWFAEAASGHWYIVRGTWNEGFFKQVGSFPIARHDDRVDSVSGARISLAPIFQWKKIEFIKL